MRAIYTLIVAGLFLAGCQTQTPDKPSPTSTTLAPEAMPTRAQPQASGVPDRSVAFDVDDCAARMQTIEGQLMLYYFKYHRLPLDLDELRSVADPGEEVPFECPTSHKPYTYNPAGMVFGNDVRRLIVYDATPAHNGSRWGILFGQAKGREPVNMQVIQIPEQSMVGYHAAPPMPAPTTPDPSQVKRPMVPDRQMPDQQQPSVQQPSSQQQ